MNISEKAPIEFFNLKQPGGPAEAAEIPREKIDFINDKVASFQTLPDIIDFLFSSFQDIIPCERIAVSFFEENGKRAVIHHVKASYESIFLDAGYSADIDNSSLEKVFAERTPRIINDLQGYLKTHPASDTTKLLVQEGINSSITIPLMVEERPVGLLFISSVSTGIYSRDHLASILKIVERIGQAVEKTWTIERLSESINSYLEMLSFVSHELKSPLDSIITLGGTLAAGYFGKMDDGHKNYVLRMVNKAKYLKEMTTEYLTLSRFENREMKINVTETDIVKSVIDESVEIVLPLAAEKKIKINNHAAGPVMAECDTTLIKIVVNNLLSNAVKYADDGGTVDIKLHAGDNELTLSVRNTGPGFPEEAKSKLFRKFSRIEKSELMKRKGTGVGLYNSWKIIRLHGGTISAESKENEWAEFSFKIPLKNTAPALN